MTHIKRISAPKTWKIKRKHGKFVARPQPGPHSKHESLALGVVLRDMLKVAGVIKDVKRLLNMNLVSIDGVIRKNIHFPVGVMDIIKIEHMGSYRMLFDKKGRLSLIKSLKDEESLKLCKITSKTAVKSGKIQLGLHDGRTILLSKSEGLKYKRAGTLLIEVPSQKIKNYIPLEKGALVYILKGKHVGEQAKVVDFTHIEGTMVSPRIVLKPEKGADYETPMSYVFAIGKTKGELKLNE
ncbi:MAG: 30S ribosomal protein S4e [Candidatus Nanoarchaeia archaeon]|nr:30S ribosomal protein S4e [Candidatus Nanoarchaeia archaeon]